MNTVGTPAPLLMPAGQHKFKEVTDLVEVSVPIRGEFPEGIQMQGSYDISPEKGVVLFGTLIQALFALNRYPAMSGDERFLISGIELQEEELVVVGRVVKLLEE